MARTSGIIAITIALSACASDFGRAFLIGSDLEEAAADLEDSKFDYETCVREQEEEDNSCDPWKDLYEEDRAAYERLLKQQKSKG
jgi:hypothetical protein